MPDPTVARFNLHGRVSLWRYRKMTDRWNGWHFAADDEGCSSLLQLFELMEGARFSSRVTLPLTAPPTAVLNVPNRETDHARPATQWTLIYPKGAAAPDEWNLSSEGSAVTLRFGSAKLETLREAVVDSRKGRGDYAIGSDDESSEDLWIWWWLRGA